MRQILIVEDDKDLANITQMNLQHAGYGTTLAYTCRQAKELLDAGGQFDLLLVDMLLPDGNGREVCSHLRRESLCPIVFFSCLDDSSTMVAAFNEGADDYVVKPVRYDVLLARIAAHLRREDEHRKQQGKKPVVNGLRTFRSFVLDTVHRQLKLGDTDVNLSNIEYALLVYMADHPDTLLLYDELYSQIWVNDSFGDVRTVMVHISNLRKKMGPERAGVIRTVRGAGYVFSDE